MTPISDNYNNSFTHSYSQNSSTKRARDEESDHSSSVEDSLSQTHRERFLSLSERVTHCACSPIPFESPDQKKRRFPQVSHLNRMGELSANPKSANTPIEHSSLSPNTSFYQTEKQKTLLNEVRIALSNAKPLSFIDIKILAAKIHQTKHLLKNQLEDPFDEFAGIYYLFWTFRDLEKLGPESIKSRITQENGAGVNGAYYINSPQGEHRFVFKPSDEEHPDVFKGIAAGHGAQREHLAYVLGQKKYPIPFTALVNFNGQVGSMQRFVPLTENFYSYSPGKANAGNLYRLSASHLQRCLLFDVRFHNCDRHLGNLLSREEQKDVCAVYLIDHGACMPNDMTDPLKLDYISSTFQFPQLQNAWNESIMNEFLETTEADQCHEVELMSSHGIQPNAIRWTQKITFILQETFRLNKQSRESQRAEISPVDIALLILRVKQEICELENMQSILDFLKDIIEQKTSWNNSPSKSNIKFIQARRKFCHSRPTLSLGYIEVLFGAHEQEIDKNSIIGRLTF